MYSVVNVQYFYNQWCAGMTLCGAGLTCYWPYWECTALLSAWRSFTFSLQPSPGPITCQDNQRRPCFILVIEIENTLHLAAEIGGSDENFRFHIVAKTACENLWSKGLMLVVA
jgi:hypothetical protein